MTSGTYSGDSPDGHATVLPTLAHVLALPALQAGRPVVLAGEQRLDTAVRWLHVSELEDISRLLRGGELILTTGIALPHEPDKIRSYIEDLVTAGASGLLIETGRKFKEVPDAMVRACARAGLPLIQLRREVAFVHVTEAVHAGIVQEQFRALNVSQRAHQVFTSLCIEGAGVADIVSATAKMVRAPVIFEDLTHRVMAYDALDAPLDELLTNWPARSRAVRIDERTGWAEPEGWAITSVEAHGEVFGRLIVVAQEAASGEQLMILERAATALTLSRLLSRDATVVENSAHSSILSDILEHRYASDREMHTRTAAVGVPTEKRTLLAIAIRTLPTQAAPSRVYRSGRDANRIAASIRSSGTAALASTSPDGTVAVMVTLDSAKNKDVILASLADTLHKQSPDAITIGVGSPVATLADLPRSFSEARHVLAAAGATKIQRSYYEMPDVQLRGLLYTLADDPRLQAFLERMLGPLLEHDSRNGADLVTVLSYYLSHNGNKSEAAAAAHMSRQSFYQRLSTIARVLAVDLDSADVRTSLHAAVMALEATSGQ